MRELPTICVDSSEFVVSKLKDRGTHQAFGVVTNAQDFMHILAVSTSSVSSRPAPPPAASSRVARGRGDDDSRPRRASVFSARSPQQVAAGRIAEIHFFAPIKQGGVESGVAVVAATERAPEPVADQSPIDAVPPIEETAQDVADEPQAEEPSERTAIETEVEEIAEGAAIEAQVEEIAEDAAIETRRGSRGQTAEDRRRRRRRASS